MANNFSELFRREEEKLKASITLKDGTPVDLKEFYTNVELMEHMMKDPTYKGPRVHMNEALQAADASILFPKVISDVLIRPLEPIMIGQTLLSKTIKIDNVRSVEFPTMAGVVAYDMSETQEYREQLAAFGESIVEIKTNKVGVLTGVSEMIVKESMWDVLALYVEQAGNAMIRHKEEKIFNEFLSTGHRVFDNSLTNPSAWTTGRGSAQTPNYSVTFDDFIDAMGALVSQEYIPTDIIMHPMAWAVFAKDPILRNVMYTRGQVGQSIWTAIPDFDQKMNVPWNVAYQVTPFVRFELGAQLSTGPASAMPATNITDIYVIDRNNSCIVLQSEEMQTVQFDDPKRDITNMKFRERYGVGSLNGGRASAIIANVLLNENWKPINAMYTVTPS